MPIYNVTKINLQPSFNMAPNNFNGIGRNFTQINVNIFKLKTSRPILSVNSNFGNLSSDACLKSLSPDLVSEKDRKNIFDEGTSALVNVNLLSQLFIDRIDNSFVKPIISERKSLNFINSGESTFFFFFLGNISNGSVKKAYNFDEFIRSLNEIANITNSLKDISIRLETHLNVLDKLSQIKQFIESEILPEIKNANRVGRQFFRSNSLAYKTAARIIFDLRNLQLQILTKVRSCLEDLSQKQVALNDLKDELYCASRIVSEMCDQIYTTNKNEDSIPLEYWLVMWENDPQLVEIGSNLVKRQISEELERIQNIFSKLEKKIVHFPDKGPKDIDCVISSNSLKRIENYESTSPAQDKLLTKNNLFFSQMLFWKFIWNFYEQQERKNELEAKKAAEEKEQEEKMEKKRIGKKLQEKKLLEKRAEQKLLNQIVSLKIAEIINLIKSIERRINQEILIDEYEHYLNELAFLEDKKSKHLMARNII